MSGKIFQHINYFLHTRIKFLKKNQLAITCTIFCHYECSPANDLEMHNQNKDHA